MHSLILHYIFWVNSYYYVEIWFPFDWIFLIILFVNKTNLYWSSLINYDNKSLKLPRRWILFTDTVINHSFLKKLSQNLHIFCAKIISANSVCRYFVFSSQLSSHWTQSFWLLIIIFWLVRISHYGLRRIISHLVVINFTRTFPAADWGETHGKIFDILRSASSLSAAVWTVILWKDAHSKLVKYKVYKNGGPLSPTFKTFKKWNA